MRGVLLVGASLALLVAGCGSAKSSTTTGSKAYATKPPGTVQPGSHPSSLLAAVTISGGSSSLRFAPARMTVRSNTVVTFVNKTNAPQTVAFRIGNVPTQRIPAGGKTSVVLRRPLSYLYYDTSHPSAKGSIIVQQGKK